MHKKVKKILVLIIGIIFIILGLLGLVLPFLQGILFLAIGLILLSFHSERIRLWIEHHTIKYPRLFAIVKKIEKTIVNIVGEI